MTIDEALDALLGTARTGDLRVDLIAGLQEAMRRREQNSAHGGAVIAALTESGLSYRDIENLPASHGQPRSVGQCHPSAPTTADQVDAVRRRRQRREWRDEDVPELRG